MLRFEGLLGLPALLAVVGLWAVAFAVASLPAMRRRAVGARGEVVAVGVLAVLWGLFWWRVLFERGVSVPKGGGDFSSFSYPLSAFAAREIQAGRFPLWNPHLFAGMPFAADYLAGALYPPNLLVWALARPFTYGTFTALILVHFWWASVTAYGFARTVGMRRVAAVLVGVVFAYGWLPPQLGHAQMVAAVAWIPAVLAALYRARHGGLGWTVLAALALVMQAFAGHPQTLLYTLTVAVAYLLFLAWREWTCDEYRATSNDGEGGAARRAALRRFWGGVAFRLAVLLGTVGGLAAPLILPATQLARRSVRAGIGYDSATQYSVHPFTLLQLVLPKVFGDNPTNYYYSQFFSGETWGYAGVVTLVLAAVGLLWRGRANGGQKLFFAAVGVVAMLAALGPFTPLHGWLYGFVPGYDKLRAAGRMFMWYGLAVGLLAGYGVEMLGSTEDRESSNEQETKSALLRTVRFVLLGLIVALVVFVIPLFYSLVLQREEPVNRPVIVLDGLNLLVLWLVGAAVLVWLAERGRMTARTLGGLAIALVVLDLFSATGGFNPTTDDVQAGYNQPVARQELRNRAAAGPLFRVDTDDVSDRWQPDATMLDGVDSASGIYDPLQLADYATFRERAQSSRSSAIYGLLNIAYVALPSEKPAPSGWTKAFVGDKVTFYMPSRPPLPRAFVVPNVEAVADPGAAFDRIKSPDFDPTKIVYVQGGARPGNFSPGTSTVTVTRANTDSLSVHVVMSEPGYLVVTDAYYPGWTATVDGHELQIFQADLAFRAVYLSGGEQTVEFRFQPLAWADGWLLFGITAAGVVALLVVSPLVRRRQRRGVR